MVGAGHSAPITLGTTGAMVQSTDIVDEFKFNIQDTALLEKLNYLSDARKYEALQALPKFGVTTFAQVKETNPEMAEKTIRGWAYVLKNNTLSTAAREELNGLVK